MTPSAADRERARDLADGLCIPLTVSCDECNCGCLNAIAQALADVRAEERRAILGIVATEMDLLRDCGVPYAFKVLAAAIRSRTEPASSEE